MKYLFDVLAAAAAYFYYHLQFFHYVDIVMERPPTRRLVVWSTFLVNYAVFVVCSMFQLHLVFNWAVFAVFLVLEVYASCRQSWMEAIGMALMGVVSGLAVNIFSRCLLALAMDVPLAVFDNNVLAEMDNLKHYPVFLGFLITGAVFHSLNRRGTSAHHRVLLGDKGAVRFLVRLFLVLYGFLMLNLLAYYTGGDGRELKLWGLKSAAFAMLGLSLGFSYTLDMTRLSAYQERNRRLRGDLLERRREGELIRALACTDPLTGCGDRSGAEEQLAALGEDEDYCICFCDLDGLKQMNDRHGHPAGDRYLLLAARSLQDAARTGGGELFRYGGDEFLLLFHGMAPSEVRPLITEAAASLAAAGAEESLEVPMSLSWGLAASREATDVRSVLRLADARMYEQRRAGR